MRSEGRPECAPAPVDVPLSPADRVVAKDWATTQAMARKYRDRSDPWGKGFKPARRVRNVGDVRSEEVPALEGKLGEIAFVYYINNAARRELLKVDFEERRQGDGGSDFELVGYRIDVKTRTYGSPSLVRKTDSAGRDKPLLSHRYVFAWLDRDLSRVQLLGWASRECVMSCPVRQSRYGHMNYEVPDERLESMRTLATLAKGGL